jgi:sarcosine oxidase subunit beta
MAVSVVGAGISGLSIALQLLERGLGPVTVVERTGVAAGASGIQPGGVRRQWTTHASCSMASESYAFWRELGEPFTACGYLFLADAEETLDRLEAGVAVQHTLEIPSRLLPPPAISQLVPGLDPAGLRGGAWCAEDGYFDRPQAVVERVAREVAARGGELRIDVVRRIARDGGGWRLELRHGEPVVGDALVVAAGGETRALVAPLGFDLPIVEEPRTLFLSEPIRERLVEPLVIAVDRGIAAKQLADGRVLASDLRRPRTSATDRLHEELDRLLPVLQFVPFPIVATGMYDMTPDAQPVVDSLDDGLWVAAGFSGHGFMVAPSTGRLVADGLAGASLPEWSVALRADRFAAHPEREANVI